MRISLISAIGLVVVLAMGESFATAQNIRSFPWRSGQTTTNDVSVGNSGAVSVRAPVTKVRTESILNRFKPQENQDAQPSLSDVDVPTPPISSSEPAPNFAPGQTVQGQILADNTNAAPVVSSGVAQTNITSAVDGCGCGPTANACGGCGTCDLGTPWRLFRQRPCGINIGGFAQFGYHDGSTGLFNNRPHNLAPHQVWLHAEKLARPRNGGWGLGYRFDGLYGLDAQNTQAFGNSPTGAPTGWDNDWDNDDFGFAIPQVYAQLANQTWDIRIGKFFSQFGAESIAANENFFYSRTYTNVLSSPFTFTGVRAERQISQNRSVFVGGALGWDTGFDQNGDGAVFISGTTYTPSDNVTLGLSTSTGDTGIRGDGTLWSAVGDIRLTRRLRWAIQGNFLDLDDNQDLGLVNALYRDINCHWTLGSRIEWWKSDQFTVDTRSTYAFTTGANYRPNANLVFRPELRWDWGQQAVNNGAPIFGIDMIMLF